MLTWLIAAGSRLAGFKHGDSILVGALCLFVGLGIGNFWATKQAVKAATETALAYKDREQAAITTAIVDYHKQHDRDVAAEIQRRQDAADDAQRQLASSREASADAANQARVVLARQAAQANEARRLNDDLRNVNRMLADAARSPSEPAVCGDALTRRVLDSAASGKASPGPVGAAPAPSAAPAGGAAAGAPPGPAAPDRLTCDQLRRGYVDLAEWGNVGWSNADAWLAWYRREFPAVMKMPD